ncbi:MAG: hypothetical protein K5787_15825 [Lentisphaeria bacterium]|nr:hypothetical protein [Victivallales bacterium]MCR4575228.1 hypothetical protein [Lentisphaeria bacterium]
MNSREQLDIICKICEEDTTYPPMAYFFVRDTVFKALNRIAEHNKKIQYGDEDPAPADISGRSLTFFLRDQLLEEFGPFAIDILDAWNVKKTADFGKIVFNLTSKDILGKSERDSIEDFDDVFDFIEAFVLPFKTGKGPGNKKLRA